METNQVSLIFQYTLSSESLQSLNSVCCGSGYEINDFVNAVACDDDTESLSGHHALEKQMTNMLCDLSPFGNSKINVDARLVGDTLMVTANVPKVDVVDNL